MQLPINLLLNEPDIIHGLASGNYVRYGSVIREAAGKPTGGQIVRHLMEAPSMSRTLMKSIPASPLGAVGSAVNTAQLGHLQHTVGQVQQTVGQVLQLSQVSAVASVLNVGVSAIGFAYMGYKLNQLQDSIGELHEKIDDMDEKLDSIQGHLGYLEVLLHRGGKERAEMLNALTEIRRGTIVKEVAAVASELEDLARFADTEVASLRTAIKTCGRARRLLSDQMAGVQVRKHPRQMLLADAASRGWAAAVSAEIRLLMQVGKPRQARQLADEESERFRQKTTPWAEHLLGHDREELRTARRFSAERFDRLIEDERVDRIARLSPHDRGEDSQKQLHKADEANLELKSVRSRNLGEEWVRNEAAHAELLDGFSDLCERLESQRELAAYCEEAGVEASDLLKHVEDKEEGEKDVGVYLLDVTE